jgi:hypothetical protein
MSASSELQFELKQGREANYFRRSGGTAVHTAITSGPRSSIIVAFAAQDSALSLWLKPNSKLTVSVKPHIVRDGRLHGVKFELQPADRLRIERAVLGSVRTVRDYEHDGSKPAAIQEAIKLNSDTVVFSRASLDGKAIYSMKITGQEVRRDRDGTIEVHGPRVSVEAMTSEAELKPMHSEDIIEPEYLAKLTRDQVEMISFLFYREKFLAGSWRYLTYFGRDSIIMSLLLSDLLKVDAMEAVVGSVFNRMSKDGSVAHEEEIGDYASYRRQSAGGGRSRKPIYDYKMIDDDFLLAGLMRAYLKKAAPERAAAFLNRSTVMGRTYREALQANLKLALNKAQPFADHPVFTNLISLRPDETTGNWRDSQHGLGESGRYPFDVNVAMVPMALDVAAQIFFDTNLGLADKSEALRAIRSYAVWSERARPLFQVTISAGVAKERSTRYAAKMQLPAPPASDGPVRFSALALDSKGRPIPVMHSDEGFVLLFTKPSPAVLKEIAQTVSRKFPLGLNSPVGMFISNPAYAPPHYQNLFTPHDYHGALVWSWPMALMAKGFRAQRQRPDLDDSTQAQLGDAENSLWESIEKMRPLLSTELWSWTADQSGLPHYVPFGQNRRDETVSNALQGWSLAFLAVTQQPPSSTVVAGSLSAGQ